VPTPSPGAQMATVERLPSAPTAPHNLDAEQSVLGAILLSERALYPVAVEDGLKPEDFYREQHRVIYSAMLALHENGDPIDVVTLTEHLRERGRLEAAGGEAALHGLAGSVPAVGHVRRYAQIVQDNALSRALLDVAYETQASVAQRSASPRELLEERDGCVLISSELVVVDLGRLLAEAHPRLVVLHGPNPMRGAAQAVAYRS